MYDYMASEKFRTTNNNGCLYSRGDYAIEQLFLDRFPLLYETERKRFENTAIRIGCRHPFFNAAEVSSRVALMPGVLRAQFQPSKLAPSVWNAQFPFGFEALLDNSNRKGLCDQYRTRLGFSWRPY
jgi:hypothetical protein